LTDNIDVQPGERPGKVAVATDEIGGVHYPVYKTAYGADGSQTPVSPSNGLPVQITGTTIDSISGAVTTIQEEHALVHQGKMFSSFHEFTSVAAGSFVDVLIQGAAGVFPHFRSVRISTQTTPAIARLYKGATFSDAGTSVTAHNLNDISSIVSGITLTHTPTVTDAGTQKASLFMPTTKSSGAIGDETAMEWIFNESEDWLIRITNESSQTSSLIVLNLYWYEL